MRQGSQEGQKVLYIWCLEITYNFFLPKSSKWRDYVQVKETTDILYSLEGVSHKLGVVLTFAQMLAIPLKYL